MALMVVVSLVCLLIPKLIKLCTVNMDHFLHVSQASVKWFQRRKQTQALEADLSSARGL